MIPEQNTDRQALAESKLIDVFREKEDFVKLLSSYVEATQEAEDVLFDVLNGFWISTAVGEQLDAIGEIVGEDRRGATDTRYRLRISVRILLNLTSGTPNQVIRIVNMILSGTGVTSKYTPQYPAAYLMELFGASSEEEAEEAGAAVLEATGAGIGVAVIYSIAADADTFTFSDTSAVQTDTARGFLVGLPILSLLASTSLHLVAEDWDGSSATWNDRSGAGNNATRVGTLTLEDSANFFGRKTIRGGSARGFHAPGDDFTAATTRTYELVLDDYGTGPLQYILARTDAGNTQIANWLSKNFIYTAESTVYNNAATAPWMGSDAYGVNVREGLPTMFHVVVDGPNRLIKVYENGVLLTQFNNPLNGTLATPAGQSIGIFNRWTQSAFTAPEYFNGTIMEVARHETLLDQTSIDARVADFMAQLNSEEIGGRLAGLISNT